VIREPLEDLDAPSTLNRIAGARRRRSHLLQAAILTGSVAKGLAVAVQLIAIGIAVRVLGPDALGSYLVMASVVAWLGLAAIGVGPGLTQRIAIATANDDQVGQATAFSSSLALAGLLVGVATVGMFVLASLAFQGKPGEPAVSADVRTAALILGLATAAQVWLSVVEAAQLGHQEQFHSNMFQALGLATVLLTFAFAGSALVTVTAFVAATACPPLAARIVNAITYVARRRYLITREVSFREAVAILSSSVAFAAVQLGATASQQLGFLWLAFVAGPAATVAIGVMFRLNYAASGVVSLLTQPLWPAVAEATASDDTAWARQAYRRAVWLTFAYASAYAIGLMTVGLFLIRMWTGRNLDISQLMMFAFGLYFIAGVWAHINAITLVGLGKVWVAARVTGVEALASCVGAVLLVGAFGAIGVIVSMLIASALVSDTILPVAVRRSWPAPRRAHMGTVPERAAVSR
jgi:O-antigen/teichoic acid export membrane protein